MSESQAEVLKRINAQMEASARAQASTPQAKVATINDRCPTCSTSTTGFAAPSVDQLDVQLKALGWFEANIGGIIRWFDSPGCFSRWNARAVPEGMPLAIVIAASTLTPALAPPADSENIVVRSIPVSKKGYAMVEEREMRLKCKRSNCESDLPVAQTKVDNQWSPTLEHCSTMAGWIDGYCGGTCRERDTGEIQYAASQPRAIPVLVVNDASYVKAREAARAKQDAVADIRAAASNLRELAGREIALPSDKPKAKAR